MIIFMKKLYLASPLGFSEAGRYFADKILIPTLEELGYEIINPFELTPQSEIDSVLNMPYSEERREKMVELNRNISTKDDFAIQDCGGLIAILDGVDVDSGTACEIGYATALGKTTLGYRGDFRLSSENEGGKVNIMVEYCINKNGGKIVSTIEDLKKEVVILFPNVD